MLHKIKFGVFYPTLILLFAYCTSGSAQFANGITFRDIASSRISLFLPKQLKIREVVTPAIFCFLAPYTLTAGAHGLFPILGTSDGGNSSSNGIIPSEIFNLLPMGYPIPETRIMSQHELLLYIGDLAAGIIDTVGKKTTAQAAPVKTLAGILDLLFGQAELIFFMDTRNNLTLISHTSNESYPAIGISGFLNMLQLILEIVDPASTASNFSTYAQGILSNAAAGLRSQVIYEKRRIKEHDKEGNDGKHHNTADTKRFGLISNVLSDDIQRAVQTFIFYYTHPKRYSSLLSNVQYNDMIKGIFSTLLHIEYRVGLLEVKSELLLHMEDDLPGFLKSYDEGWTVPTYDFIHGDGAIF